MEHQTTMATSLEFRIANALLNQGMIREAVTTVRLEAVIREALDEVPAQTGGGEGRAVHLRDARFRKSALCNHPAEKSLMLTGDRGAVTCKRCRISMLDQPDDRLVMKNER